MAAFDPLSALFGGALIGLAAVLLMLFLGRVAGISGIAAGILDPAAKDKGWRAAFVAGLIGAPLLAGLFGHPLPSPELPESSLLVAFAGLFVGFGTRLGSGCTSGHGVCGMARLSPRSIAATLIFIVTAMLIVALMRHAGA